jgi:teichuronic acid biosynthesis glycosyltransferase TuaC
MKVLFVSSGNAKDGISPIVLNQGQSLIDQGVIVDFFTINGKGILSYFSHIFILRNFLKTNKFDIIHSHYSFSSYVASFSSTIPLVVSLMGSDVLSNRFSRFIISIFHKYMWDKTIVKSVEMHQRLGFDKIEIIPNGVNIDKINFLSKENCRHKLGWIDNKKHILFASDPSRKEKNFSLVRNSIRLLKQGNKIIVHFLKDIPNEDILFYLNATDILILCSLYEGSPNIIKEAMACNCPIVTTNVGDVKWVIGNTEGCFITSFNTEDVAEKIKLAINFREKHGFTNGRERIIKLGLDSVTIAGEIIKVYNKMLMND